MKRKYSEEERKAVFNHFIKNYPESFIRYEDVNPKAVDNMIDTYTGQNIILGIRVGKISTAFVDSYKEVAQKLNEYFVSTNKQKRGKK